MTKILAIDTSALTASCAVLNEATVLGSVSFTCGLNHSQTIMPMVDFLLKCIGFEPKDIDIFACANGPGSFTGLRIGIGTVKGLAFGAGKKTVGVSTLKALAYNVPETDYLISPIMDARRNQVYNALYRYKNGKITEVCAPRALSLADLLAEINEKTIFVGDGVSVHRNYISDALYGKAVFAQPNICLSSAASVALAAAGEEGTDCENLEAVYLRKSQAERLREGGKD